MKHLPTDSSKTSAIDALADFYLTEQEWNYLLALRAAEHGLERAPMDTGDPGAMADICVLAGVAERPDPDSGCLLYTSPSPRDVEESRMPSSA